MSSLSRYGLMTPMSAVSTMALITTTHRQAVGPEEAGDAPEGRASAAPGRASGRRGRSSCPAAGTRASRRRLSSGAPASSARRGWRRPAWPLHAGPVAGSSSRSRSAMRRKRVANSHARPYSAGDQQQQRLVAGDEREVLQRAADHGAQQVAGERHVRGPACPGTSG